MGIYMWAECHYVLPPDGSFIICKHSKILFCIFLDGTLCLRLHYCFSKLFIPCLQPLPFLISKCLFFIFIFLSFIFLLFLLLLLFFLFVVNSVIHWNEKALGSHVFPWSLEFREGQGGSMKPISCNQETRDTGRFLCPRALQGHIWCHSDITRAVLSRHLHLKVT